MNNPTDIHTLRLLLLDHYEAHGRTLPWRVRPEDRAAGQVPDPYAVWLSEIILQQTTVPHGTPYWHKFLNEFPTVTDLANANRDKVLTLWAGLGYYARARNLHKCAQLIRDEYDGEFPTTETALLKLPGIGPYTAATIAAICFNEPTNIVDGNVERVISRMFRINTPLPKGRKDIRKAASTLVADNRPGDYGQALMDLGSQICTPRSPKCWDCPWRDFCQARAAGDQTNYPVKLRKTKLPIRYGAIFVLRCGEAILLRQRPDKGLLGGMMGFPGSDWGDKIDNPLRYAPLERNWEKIDGEVRHIFTHFDLRLEVYVAETTNQSNIDGIWAGLKNIDTYALPTVMKKVLEKALTD